MALLNKPAGQPDKSGRNLRTKVAGWSKSGILSLKKVLSFTFYSTLFLYVLTPKLYLSQESRIATLSGWKSFSCGDSWFTKHLEPVNLTRPSSEKLIFGSFHHWKIASGFTILTVRKLGQSKLLQLVKVYFQWFDVAFVDFFMSVMAFTTKLNLNSHKNTSNFNQTSIDHKCVKKRPKSSWQLH